MPGGHDSRFWTPGPIAFNAGGFEANGTLFTSGIDPIECARLSFKARGRPAAKDGPPGTIETAIEIASRVRDQGLRFRAEPARPKMAEIRRIAVLVY